jgi:hypothetical protein
MIVVGGVVNYFLMVRPLIAQAAQKQGTEHAAVVSNSILHSDREPDRRDFGLPRGGQKLWQERRVRHRPGLAGIYLFPRSSVSVRRNIRAQN